MHKIPYYDHHSIMTGNDEENTLTIRDNVIAEQSEMIAELARKLEMLRGNKSHSRFG